MTQGGKGHSVPPTDRALNQPATPAASHSSTITLIATLATHVKTGNDVTGWHTCDHHRDLPVVDCTTEIT